VPRTLEEIVAKAISFPISVAGDKSVPYTALLQDYRAIDVAGTPTWIDTQNARDTLLTLESTRRFIQQKISDVDYILQNQAEFAGLDDGKLSQINATRELLRQQLVQTSRAASRCAHDVMDCEPAALEMPNLGFLQGFELPLHVGDTTVPGWTPQQEERLVDLRHKLTQVTRTLDSIDNTLGRYQAMLGKNKQATLTKRDRRTNPPTITTHKVSDLKRELVQRQAKVKQEQSEIVAEMAKLEKERAGTLGAGTSKTAPAGQPRISLKAAAFSTPAAHLVTE
jgi:hypothetical protein